MSYCRWSSDNFRCDLYCYEHCDGGFTTHVASRVKIFRLIPSPHIWTGARGWFGVFLWRIWGWLWRMELAIVPFRDLRLPYAGETFNDPDLESFRDRLIDLKARGYRFPPEVLDEVNAEIACTTKDERVSRHIIDFDTKTDKLDVYSVDENGNRLDPPQLSRDIKPTPEGLDRLATDIFKEAK